MDKRTAIVSIAVLLCSVQCSFAQITRVEVMTLENCDRGYCQRVPGIGSGVVVGHTDDGQSVVVTAGHMLNGRVESVKACQEPATVVAVKCDGRNDIAILLVPGEFPVSELGDDPQAGEDLKLCGFPGGNFLCRDGRAIDADLASMPTDQGFSGGPLVDRNKRVRGICFGYVKSDVRRRTLFTPSGRVRDFVRSKVRMRTVRSEQFAIAPPPPPEVKPPGAPQSSNIESRLAAIEQAIAAIKTTQGPAGPQGPPGKDGKDGASSVADLAAIRADVAALKSIKIPVQVLAADGTIYSQETVNLGDPIRLRLVPKQK